MTMKFFAIIFFAAALVNSVFAQNKPANIAYVYPAGAQRATKTRIILGGTDFVGATAVFVSGKGVSCEIKEIINPPEKGKIVSVRNAFEKKYIEDNPEIKQELKKASENEDPKVIAAVRKKIYEGYSSIPENAAKIREVNEAYYLRYVSADPLAETIEVELDIDGNAELGERDIKVLTPLGLSNCAKIMIGNLPEFSKPSLREQARTRIKEPKYWSGMNIKTWKDLNFILPSERQTFDVKLPTYINGQIVEEKTDFYRFDAKKGQKIIAAVWAQALLPYISDAVPGWFQTVLILRDSSGKEIAYNDDFQHRPDSLLVADIPEDGKYTLEVRDAIYRSREDFVYRILIGELPFVTSVFPLGFNEENDISKDSSSPYREGKFELSGINLDKKNMVLKADADGKILFENDKYFSRVIKVDPQKRKAEFAQSEIKNLFGGSSNTAQKITLPAFIDGRISAPAKSDKYSFYAKEGEPVVIETFARRLDSPLDSVLELSDSSGKIVACADDYEDLSCGLVTHHADSRLEFTPKQSGIYTLRVFDARGEGSPEHSYRLSIAKPIPDFQLRGDPANINIRPKEVVSVRVTAFRKDGMDAPINLAVKNLPKGFKITNNVIAKGKNSAYLMISAPEKFNPQVCALQIEGTAKVGDKTIVRRVVPCQEMMQAFYYLHLVPCAEFSLSANAFAGFSKGYSNLNFDYGKFLRSMIIPEKGTTRIAVGYFRNGTPRHMTASLVEPVDGLKVLHCYGDSKTRILYVNLECDPSKLKIGDTGEFTLAIKGRSGRDFVDICKIPPIKFAIGNKKQHDEFNSKQWRQTSSITAEILPKKNIQKNKGGEAKKSKQKVGNDVKKK